MATITPCKNEITSQPSFSTKTGRGKVVPDSVPATALEAGRPLSATESTIVLVESAKEKDNVHRETPKCPRWTVLAATGTSVAVLCAGIVCCCMLIPRNSAFADATDPETVEPNILAANSTTKVFTPPMGFNTWNAYGCQINQTIIRRNAELMISRGYVKAGYKFMNVDDCYSSFRNNKTQEMVPDPVRFKDGIKPLADFVHANGMKFGIYSSAGTKTCEGKPGSLGHEDIDAKTFVKWGVDFLKYDNCYDNGVPAKIRFPAMANALKRHANKTKEPIIFSMCAWGRYDEWTWAWPFADTWRVSPDICRSWSANCEHDYAWPVTRILDKVVPLARYAGPARGFNDMDMLTVGTGVWGAAMTLAEQRSHFLLWAALKSPLIVGADIQTMPAASEKILLSPEVIAVNQDPKGKPVQRVWRSRTDGNGTEIFMGELSDDIITTSTGTKNKTRSAVVVLLNRTKRPAYLNVQLPWVAPFLGLAATKLNTTEFIVRDLFKRKTLATKWPGKRAFNGAGWIDSHDAVMLKFSIAL